MNTHFASPLFCLILAAGSLRAADASIDPMAEALPVLQAKFVDFSALKVGPQDHLGDLVARSQGEINVAPAAPNAAPVPILTTLLPGGMIYCRLASFQATDGWAALGAQLDKWIGDGAQGIVLDLRSNSAPNDFDGAAHVASFFTPLGTPLFTMQAIGQNSHAYISTSPVPGPGPVLITEPMTVLVNHRTTGAAEALAACLKADGALLIGQSTMGRGALFGDDRLSSGQDLSYLAAHVTLADGTPLWNHPIQPDIGLNVDEGREQASLGLIGQNRVLDVVEESAGSHRLSEAALVRGEDPEVEAYLTLDKKGDAAHVPQDVALVNALDSLKAIHLSQRPPAPGPAPEIPSTVQ